MTTMPPTDFRRLAAVLVGGLLALAPAAAAQTGPTPSPEAVRFFEARVRPLLAEHCFQCHGEKKQRGGLRLDSREAALAGGDRGPALVPGEPGKSLLLRAVRHEDEQLQMPPKKKLTPQQ